MTTNEHSTTPSDGGPAFPCAIDEEGGWYNKKANGMSLRDWFAGQALAGYAQFHKEDMFSGHIARNCYQLADAMLAARQTSGTKTQAIRQ